MFTCGSYKRKTNLKLLQECNTSDILNILICTHSSDGNQLVEVVNVNMDENAKQSRENLLANCHVVLGERNALKEKLKAILRSSVGLDGVMIVV